MLTYKINNFLPSTISKYAYFFYKLDHQRKLTFNNELFIFLNLNNNLNSIE